ncbi:dromaiocalcin-1-like [Oreochromis aureus]|uniref:dromaiocalcin-1-like n=1 Tax=Oreochromis aureus TaxID=47969 RepID=UPI001953A5B4|nr:dromaiocalcin-1-like [Oreochromis aureus]
MCACVSYICVHCVAVVNVLPLNACVCVIVQSEHVEIDSVLCGWIGKQVIDIVKEKRSKETKEQVVTEEKKAWEEAVEYCREHHNDLASVASETEMMLIQKELKKHNTTEHVWIGLRFLSRDWLWVDGEELDYEAWVEGGKPLCPHPKMKCAALQVTEGSLGVWEAHDCEERRNFICY